MNINMNISSSGTKQSFSFQTTKQTFRSTTDSRIHTLGQRSKNQRQTAVTTITAIQKQQKQQQSKLNLVLNNNYTNNSKSYCRSVKVCLPVSFGIDKQQAAYLIKQLHQMKIKYSQLQKQLTQNSRIDTSMIENITQSTKNLELRMSQVRLQNQLQNQFQKQKEKQQYQNLLKQKQVQIQNCNKIIQTLNQATQKINELQNQNNYLMENKENLEKVIEQEKLKNKRITKQNQLLIDKINQLENGKELIIKGISYQLQKLRSLKINKEECSTLAERIQEVIEQHFSRTHIQNPKQQQQREQITPVAYLRTYSNKSIGSSSRYSKDFQDMINKPQLYLSQNEKKEINHSQTHQETLNLNKQNIANIAIEKTSIKSNKSNKLTNNLYKQ